VLVGKFEDIVAARPGNTGQLAKEGRYIGGVVDGPDLDQGVKEAGNEGHFVPVAGDEVKTGIAGQVGLGFTKEGAGIIEEDDSFVSVVFIGQTAETGPDVY
jgi:hypothetical protein